MISRTQRREAALRQRWLAILQAELLRREGEDGGERREQALAWLTAKLDDMAANLAAAPDYQPLLAAEKRRGRARDRGVFQAPRDIVIGQHARHRGAAIMLPAEVTRRG
jgi:hypothetical protein